MTTPTITIQPSNTATATATIAGEYQCQKDLSIKIVRFPYHDTSSHLAFKAYMPAGMEADRWGRLVMAISHKLNGYLDARVEVSDIDYEKDRYLDVDILYIDIPRKWKAHTFDEPKEIIALAARFFMLGCE